MRPDRSFWMNRRVCVTGGTGFLGWQIVQQLRELGADVRVFALPPDSSHPVHGRNIDAVWGDIRDTGSVRRALSGCSFVFHAAGPVGAWGKIVREMGSVHIEGTANVLRTAPAHARIIHTSSLTTLGASPNRDIVNEDTAVEARGRILAYVRAKQIAEELALEAAAHCRNLVVTNPGYLVGPEDHQQSIMGRFCVRFWKGRVPLSPPGGLNLVDVRDAATGHLLAAETGQSGRRYILGGENHDFVSFMKMLAHVADCRPRLFARLPWLLMAGVAGLAELRAYFTGREPYPSFGHVQLNRRCWFGNSSRAARELGYTFRPLVSSLRDAYAWHQEQSAIRPRGFGRWWLRPNEREALVPVLGAIEARSAT